MLRTIALKTLQLMMAVAVTAGLLGPALAVEPGSAHAKSGAMVAANFLLSPEAQARKANPELWGGPTVLNIDALSEDVSLGRIRS